MTGKLRHPAAVGLDAWLAHPFYIQQVTAWANMGTHLAPGFA